MSNVMSLLKLRNKPSRNGFDLSRRNCFTSKVGELLPVMQIHCLPTDVFDIDCQTFSRTQPLNTAAFTRIKEYYDFFFVPYRLLFSNAPAAFAMTNEPQKARSISTGNVANTVGSDLPYITMDDLNTVLLGEDYLDGMEDYFGYNIPSKSAKLLQYLGYGFNEEILSKRNWYSADLNVFPLFAYQKIYADYFRDSQWEEINPLSFNCDYLTPSSMKVPLTDMLGTSNALNNLLTLRYCNYPADYFMGLLPNAQYGDVASVGVGANQDTYGFLLNTSNGTFIQQGGTLYGSEHSGGSPTVSFFAANNELVGASLTFNILSLRKAEALQKFREITQTQDKDYKGQMDAHFNANISPVLSDRCMWLGGCQSTIMVSDVTNTNLDQSTDTDSATKRAWIYGKGTNVVKGHLKFTAPEHGILMCIYHAIPLLDYSSNLVDPFNLKCNVEDYAIPEFDKVGMQETPLVELLGLQDDVSLSWTSKNIGYAPRYAEYKTAIDRVTGAFATTLKDWYSPLDNSYILSILRWNGSLAPLPSPDMSFWSYVKKVNPAICDTIFGVNADSSVDTDQLLCNAYFDVKAVRPLDRNGLPY